VVTKCPKNISEADKKEVVRKLKPSPDQKVLFSYLEYAEVLKGSDAAKTIETMGQENFTLVTGIANPAPLVDYLKKKGLRFEHLRYKDHHSFTKSEINILNSKEFVLTTEKDFVRLQGKVEKLAYLEIKHRFFDNDKEELVKEIEKVTKLNF